GGSVLVLALVLRVDPRERVRAGRGRALHLDLIAVLQVQVVHPGLQVAGRDRAGDAAGRDRAGDVVRDGAVHLDPVRLRGRGGLRRLAAARADLDGVPGRRAAADHAAGREPGARGEPAGDVRDQLGVRAPGVTLCEADHRAAVEDAVEVRVGMP